MRNPIQLTKAGFSIFMENPWLFVGIMLIPTIVSYLLTFLEPGLNGANLSVFDWSIFIAITLLVIVVNVLMGLALLEALRNRSLSIVGAYKMAVPNFWRYLLFSIALTLLLTVAYLLLIIPGIIASVWFAFAVFVLIYENKGVRAALRQSREYVRGRWWGVFGRLLGLLILSALFGIVLSLLSLLFDAFAPEWLTSLVVLAGNLIVAPITIGYVYSLYLDVKGDSSTEATSTVPPGYEPAAQAGQMS